MRILFPPWFSLARLDPQVPGHLRDRLARLAHQPERALPEIGVKLPACPCHRPSLAVRVRG
jgi:hypothetical protein